MVEMKPMYWGLKGNQGTMVTCLYMLQYDEIECVMCDDWIIGLYVIIIVEMKPVYWGLKGNQDTMITHAPISFRIVEYDCCYDWMINVFAIILIEMK